MQRTIEITAEEIAEAMLADPDFGMDVLAHFADDLDGANFAERGVSSRFHENAAPILKLLADDIVEAMSP